MKKLIILLLTAILSFGFVACSNLQNPDTDEPTIQVMSDGTNLLYRISEDAEWHVLSSLDALGLTDNSKSVIEVKVIDGYIQWKNADGTWEKIIAVEELKGADGKDGENGKDGTNGKDGINAVQAVYVGYGEDITINKKLECVELNIEDGEVLNTDPNSIFSFAGNCLCVAGSGTKKIYYEVSVSFKAYTQDPDDQVAIRCDFAQIAPYHTSIYARGDGTMTSQTFLVKPTSINFSVYSFAPEATIEYYIYVKKIELPD